MWVQQRNDCSRNLEKSRFVESARHDAYGAAEPGLKLGKVKVAPRLESYIL